MPPDLYFEENGSPDSHPLIFLHGLLGSSRNWRSVSKVLSSDFRTICFDLPNHGKSFHKEKFTVKEMADLIHQQILIMGISEFSICGHSLGGKVAMRMACDHAREIERLVVVDTAPRDYPPEHHLPILDALTELDLLTISSRKEADLALTEKIPNWAFRQFLLTNLDFSEGQAYWLPNLMALRDSLCNLSSNPLKKDGFPNPVLFICGGKSGYVRSEHHPLIREYFPEAQIETLPNVGHDVHVEERQGFISHLQKFLLV